MAKFTKQELIQKISCHLAGAPVTETPAVEKTATQDVIPSALLKEASEKMRLTANGNQIEQGTDRKKPNGV